MEVRLGVFYGLSVVPGDPELLTVKACRVLKACPVIAAPQSQSGEQLALSIAGQAVDLDGKALLSLPFTMSRDPEVLEAAWEKNADLVAAYLDRGADVAMVVLGDVSTYSTYCYVMERLKQRGYPTRMIPGATSFAAIAARLGESLVEGREALHVLPASHPDQLAGLDLPDSGQVLFEGTPIGDMDLDEYRRRKAAVIYQDFALFPLLTALEHIEYPMELCRVEAQEAARQARELARRVSLPDELLDRYPTHISGGEQQRVAIARGLTMDRRLLLADEPTGNLDSENSDNIIDLLLRLAHEENRCVIVVTHDLTVMDRADVVYRISDGLLQRRQKEK